MLYILIYKIKITYKRRTQRLHLHLDWCPLYTAPVFISAPSSPSASFSSSQEHLLHTWPWHVGARRARGQLSTPSSPFLCSRCSASLLLGTRGPRLRSSKCAQVCRGKNEESKEGEREKDTSEEPRILLISKTAKLDKPEVLIFGHEHTVRSLKMFIMPSQVSMSPKNALLWWLVFNSENLFWIPGSAIVTLQSSCAQPSLIHRAWHLVGTR